MQFQFIDWKKSIIMGAIAGMLWGWIAMFANTVTGAFAFEQSLLQHLVTFTVGGIIFGIVVSGFLSLLKDFLPFKNSLVSSVFIATGLWIVLFLGGYGLALADAERYHFNIPQGIQGLILAALLGVLIGFSWKIKEKEA
ncbi:MAG: hypothetical protein A2073_03015 [Deltaproteobacteria bacterium GWC2_42_11]|nr:MAG: hypothetical protein A2073_03015 [Deltaproteobacteria bacterium GWC2_42_11]HBO84929.1 hypothetical protein [Deltaproteobacteria bacterium]